MFGTDSGDRALHTAAAAFGVTVHALFSRLRTQGVSGRNSEAFA